MQHRQGLMNDDDDPFFLCRRSQIEFSLVVCFSLSKCVLKVDAGIYYMSQMAEAYVDSNEIDPSSSQLSNTKLLAQLDKLRLC